MSTAVWGGLPRTDADTARAADIGLWFFIAVATSLFSLFLTAYAMRMDGSGDWTTLAMPWQLWLSTALLAAGSLLLERARRSEAAHARRWLLAGGACAAAFVLSQLWAWQALQTARVALAGNPAASFFYLLTALHGLHVLGGLAGWAVTVRQAAHWRIALCARYWHFLFVVWALLFAAFGLLTQDVVDFICGRGP